MKTWSALLVGALVASAQAQAAVLWKGDYQTGDLSQWSKTQEQSVDRLTVVASPGGRAGYAMRTELHYGDVNSSGCRAEVVRSVPEAEGSEKWYAWSTLIPTDYPASTDWQVVTQWHHSGTDGSPPLEFDLYDHSLRLTSNGSDRLMTVPIQFGVWHDIVFHVKFSADPSVGFVEVWVDGVQTLAKKMWATSYAGQVNYLKQGLYRKATITPTAVLYHRGMVMGETRADVAPQAAPPPPPPPPPAPAPDFRLAVAPSAQTVQQGSTAQFDVTLSALNGFSSGVTYRVADLPGGVTANVTSTSTGARVSVNVAVDAPVATGAVVVSATSGALVHTASTTLTVQARPPQPPPPGATPDFALAVGTASQTIDAGQTATYPVQITRSNGFSADVQLSVTGLPQGATTRFVTSTDPAQLIVATPADATAGSYGFTVTGTANGTTHTAEATLELTSTKAVGAEPPPEAPDAQLGVHGCSSSGGLPMQLALFGLGALALRARRRR